MRTAVKFNARGEVTIPWFVVGTPEFDLSAVVADLSKVRKANAK